jgi:hypothetical protein
MVLQRIQLRHLRTGLRKVRWVVARTKSHFGHIGITNPKVDMHLLQEVLLVWLIV